MSVAYLVVAFAGGMLCGVIVAELRDRRREQEIAILVRELEHHARAASAYRSRAENYARRLDDAEASAAK